MANIVNLDRVSKAYSAVGTLLRDVSLGVGDTDRIGVVGLNGSGKSTLLRLLAGVEEPDSGRVTHRRGLRVALLPQAVSFPPAATVRDVVLAGFSAEHEWAGDAAVRTVLDGLGWPGLGMDEPVGRMSGGERRRVALAALLVRGASQDVAGGGADLLVLDEPTNHLDVASISWLAGHLAARRGPLVVVTHDRWFLDAVCTTTWEVSDETVQAYEGGFAAWTLARAERARLAAAAEARRQNLLRKEIAWLRRGPPARTSKPRFRIAAANALIADVPPSRDTVQLRRLATARLGKQVYDLAGVTLHAGQKRILDQVTWQIGPGDRVGLLGVNGVGKTSLLRLLAGDLRPSAGQLRIGKTVRTALLSQELAELPDQLRVLEAIEEVARHVVLGDRELSAAQLAEVFGFSERRLWTPVRDLSGGERRRLQLMRLLASQPNVLLLDEPTNDLDTDTLAALEDLLDGWPGTLVVASHDRYLIERVTDDTYALFGDGTVTHLPSGVDEYLARLSGRNSTVDRAFGAAGGGSAGGGSAAGGAAPSKARSQSQDQRERRKELARLERLVGKLEQQESRLYGELARHATDHEKLVELDARLREVRAEREKVEESWLVLADEMTEP